MSKKENEIESIDVPEVGVIFWPVSTGDSTTIVISSEVFMQVDLRHMAKSESNDDDSYPVVDHLIEILPKKDEKPYLSTFALTHPDQDHIQGFEQLLDSVEIGELWFTPRVFKEYQKDLCDDAVAFKKEAERRRDLAIKQEGDLNSGDKIRVIGYDEILSKDEYKGFPESLLTVPGNELSELDGEDLENFSAFIHAPHKNEDEEERNDTSLGMRVSLKNDNAEGKILLLGDLKYKSIRKIIDVSSDNNNQEKLEWNIFLSPHHCSKSVMYVKDSNDKDELKQDIIDDLEVHGQNPGFIVSSSKPIPAKNEKGDNPPHAKAKSHYQDIAPTDFICTHENPEGDTNPVIFDIENDEITLRGGNDNDGGDLDKSVKDARGHNQTPTQTAGFGKNDH